MQVYFCRGKSSNMENVPNNPLWNHSALERARIGKWLLTTSEIKELIGVKPRTKKGETIFTRGNWIFTKQGKIGNQSAWQVTKNRRS